MKTTLIAAVMLVTTCSATAQGLYMRVGAGYAIPVAGQTIDGKGLPFSGSVNNTNLGQPDGFNARKVSFSSGVTATVATGYMFNKYAGFELNATFCVAPQKYKTNGNNVLNDAGSYLMQQNITRNAKLPVFITPSAIFQTGGQWNGYSRFGVVLPVGGTIQDVQDNVYINVFNTKEHMVKELKMNFGVGFAGAAGVEYKTNEVSIFAEASAMSLSRYVSTETVTEHTVGGASTVLPLPGTVTQYTKNGNYNVQQPTYSIPFSNFGLTVGIKFNLSNTTTTN